LALLQQYQFDAYKEMEAVDEFLHGVLAAARRQQRHLGLLFVETFRSCFNDQETCDKSCGKFDQGRQGVFNTSIGGNSAWNDIINQFCVFMTLGIS
jgi:hypothetical protein